MAADVKNKRSGDKKSGKKITGMQFLGSDNTKLLITSNDSRIRLYDGESAPVLAEWYLIASTCASHAASVVLAHHDNVRLHLIHPYDV